LTGILSWTGVDDAPHRWRKVRAAWVIVSLHVCIRLTLAMWFAESPRYLLALPLLAFAAGQVRRVMRPVAVALALVQWVRFAFTYPDASNHYLIECLSIGVFALVDLEREEERALCLRMLGWVVVVVLFMSGVQKLLHGAYFKGQYLAYMVATTDRFRNFFRFIIPAADLAHLDSLRNAVPAMRFAGEQLIGAPPGPYRVHSFWFIAVSNGVWIGELTVAVGLLVRRLRPFALAGGLVLMAGILASSNELFFDTFFINLLLLFARKDLIWKLLPASLACYAYYLAVGFGIVPGGFVW
jgi:hypothetical protein